MKQLLTILLIFSALQISELKAQEYNHGLGFKVAGINYHYAYDDGDFFENWSPAVEVSYTKNLNNRFSFSLPVRLGVVNYPNYDETADDVTGYGDKKGYGGLDALIHLNILNRDKFFNPFIYAGVGAVLEDWTELGFQAPVGLGLGFNLNANTSFVVQTDYRFGFEEGRNNWQPAVGLVLNAGKCKTRDMDGDGINDKNDKCPDVAGVASLMGCPDTDGDGITDASDECPNEAGTAALNGCPDMDGDGIADVKDMCPKVKGLAKLGGCPDGDGDGIADDKDKCPTVAGTAALMGCPDRDGDGVGDEKDECPDVKGSAALMGCPDTDGDGIADAKDACPKVAGPAKFSGCPDTDGDGLEDIKDKCPATAGPIANNGCPEIKVEDKKRFEVAMKSVQFETGSAKLKSSSNKILNDIADVCGKYPEMQLNIQGNTDNVGDKAANQKLSEARAKSCMDYLISKGVSAARLSSLGNGDSNPIGDNKTSAGREANRRTEFIPSFK